MGSVVRAATERRRELQPLHQDISMLSVRTLLCCLVLLCLIQGTPAPFPRNDPRSILNPFIEPWWCRVPKIMREFLHLKFTFSPLNERGPCVVPSGRFNGK